MSFTITKIPSTDSGEGKFRISKLPEEEGLGKRALRTAAAIPTRIAQGLISSPGDVLSLAGAGQKALGGQSYEEMQQEAPVSFPTSAQTGDVIEKLTGGALEPQGGIEETIQNIAQDIGGFVPWLMFGPATGALKAVAKFLPTAITGNLAGQAVKELGGGPLAQAAAKLAGGVGANVVGITRDARKLKGHSYKVSQAAIPKGETHEAVTLRKNIHALYDEAAKHDVTGKEYLLDRVKAVDDLIADRKIGVQQAWEIKKSLNKKLGDYKVDKEIKPYIKRLVKHINEDVLGKYGEKNPTFGKHFRQAEDLHKGFNDVSAITQFLNENVSYRTMLKNKTLGGMLFGGATYAAGLSPAAIGTAAVGAAGLTARQVARFTDLMRKSPAARKLWIQSINNALTRNTPGFASTVSKLDKLAEQEGI